jgi:nicotinate-nucleotide--dimethylbenzimidazole phosphoribosyltransferase
MRAGADMVTARYQAGCNCIGFGEMGIGNTSSAALLMHSLTGESLAGCIGRGTGLDDVQLQHKIDVLEQARRRHEVGDAPLAVLATFGGFEVAMMVGAILQAAALQMVVMIDGFICTAALLVANKRQPHVADYCVFSHASDERGHRALLAHFNAKPLLQLDLRLGEGSGVALAYPLMESAVVFLNDMATFDEAGVDKS